MYRPINGDILINNYRILLYDYQYFSLTQKMAGFTLDGLSVFLSADTQRSVVRANKITDKSEGRPGSSAQTHAFPVCAV